MRRFVSSVSIIIAVACSHALVAQSVVTGTVRSDSAGRPLHGVEIILESTALRSRTDAAGRYLIEPVSPGTHILLARLIGYQPIRMRFRAGKADTVKADLVLVEAAFVLDSIAVVEHVPRPRGVGFEAFEERRRMGFGQFIDSTSLRRADHLYLPDVLRRHSSIHLVSAGGRPAGTRPGVPVYAISSRRASLSGDLCFMRVIVDGAPRPGSRPTDLMEFAVTRIEAVEVYRGAAETPAEFSGVDAACGVIAIWTKRAGN